MNAIIKNILAIIVGLFVGSLANMGIIMISSSIIPLPEGVDNSTMEGLQAGMHLMQPQHFLMPFLAHALGTFVGALLAALIAANHKMKLALVIGFFFLAGGIMMVVSVPSPLWFTAVDLVLAYIPMAYFAGKLIEK